MMKCVLISFCAVSVLLLCACENNATPPAPVSLEEAAQRWDSARKTWSETDLYLLERGRSLYQGRCAACHLSSGEGQQTMGVPALKGSAIARGSAEILIAIVLNGRNSMPAFSRSVDDADLAAILSYVRNAWGNNSADVIGPDAIAAMRTPGR